MAGMGREERNPSADLIEELQTTAPSASFFQIVRLFHRMAKRRPRGGVQRPRDEPVRFRAATGMGHPASEIVKAALRPGDNAPELTVSFMGLTGPTGALPDYYTELLIQQSQARNPGAADYLDMFNHKTIALFYRAGTKYRLPTAYEDAPAPLTDPYTRSLAAIMGLGLDASRPILTAQDGDVLSVAGAMARRVRSAHALRSMLSSLYELPVEIVELQGRWISIAEGERTRLGGQGDDRRFGVLGETAVVGAKVWDIQSRFRIRVGPIGLKQFREFLPQDGLRGSMADLVRLAVGAAMAFDIQLVLKRDEAPPIRLGDTANPARLGQTTWMFSTTPTEDLDDAVLSARATAMAQ